MRFRLPIVLGAALGMGLACAGLPSDPEALQAMLEGEAVPTDESDATEADVAAIAPGIQELIDAEDPDGALDAGERAERAEALSAFVDETEDFGSWRAVLLDRQATDPVPTEAAFAEVTAAFTDKEPQVVECAEAACAVVLMVAHGFRVDEEWAAASEAVHRDFSGTKAVVTSLERGVSAVKLGRGDAVVRELDVTPFLADDRLTRGYLLAKAEGDPAWREPGAAEAVVEAAARTLGVCPKSGCPDGVEEAKAVQRRRARPAPAPEPEPEPLPEPELPVEEVLPDELDIPDLEPIEVPEAINKRKKRKKK